MLHCTFVLPVVFKGWYKHHVSKTIRFTPGGLLLYINSPTYLGMKCFSIMSLKSFFTKFLFVFYILAHITILMHQVIHSNSSMFNSPMISSPTCQESARQ